MPFGSNFSSLVAKFGSNFDSLFNVAAPPPPLILDTLSAAAAYSLRLLRAAYTGFCVRVRRSSNNDEQNIGFVGGVIDTVALLAFVGAGDGFITTWYDQSVNALNATQATAANQPRIVNAGVIEIRNSKPTAFFNRPTANSLSIGVVASFNIGTLVAVASYNAATFTSFDGCFTGTDNASARAITGNSGTSSLVFGSSFINGVSTLVVSMNSILDVLILTDTVAASTNLFIGIDREVVNRNWNGSISECVTFATQLSTADRQLLESNQKSFYNTP